MRLQCGFWSAGGMAVDMTRAIGTTFGADLLKHLGIEEQNIKGFTIRVYAGEVVTITVERLLRNEDEDVLTREFQEYEVVSKGSIDTNA